MKKIITFLFAIFMIVPVFATGVSGGATTCDSGALGTDNGSTILRANYEPETIHLRWYDENNNLLTVNSTSQSCTYGESITIPTAPTKTGYRFTGWTTFSDYTPIEYIESTGTQWIDTGFKFTGNVVKYDLVYNMPAIVDDTNLFCASNNDNNWACGPYFWNDIFYLYIGSRKDNGGASPVYTTTSLTGTKVTLSLTLNRINNSFTILHNGVTYSDVFSGTITNTTSLVLFAHNTGSSITQRSSYKNYGFKITMDSIVVCDMIPVKDIHGVPCMYDKVSGQFFYNAGSGNFVAGPDL